MTQKVMPYSPEAEESLLGNIMLYEDAMQESDEAGLVASDFYLDKHRQIYNIMDNMYQKKEKIDVTSLSSKLKDFEIFEKIGGFEYLLHLTSSTISRNNTKEYIDIIKNKSIARKIIEAGQRIADDGYNGSVAVDELVDNAEKYILDVTRSRTVSDFRKAGDVFGETIDKIEKIQERGSTITGVRSLFSALDNMTTGFQRGDLIILAARPSVGKTAFALNVALNAASVSSDAVAIFSLEMPSEQLATRMLAIKSEVQIQKLRTGKLDDNEWSLIHESVQELKRQKLYIDDTPGIKINDIFAKCRKLKNDHGLSLVIIDYMQLILSSGRIESRQQEVSEISRRLKALARELDVPVIALSQLSRAVEQRNDKRPMLSDLRESGSIEQDADLVMFLYRDEYYQKEEEKSAEKRVEVELSLAKHRNGPTGKVILAFEKEINRFYSVENSRGIE